MSKILNRPMFRGGGRVSSYNTGITSGLGYARGGQVPPKRGFVDGPGGYAGTVWGSSIVPPTPTGSQLISEATPTTWSQIGRGAKTAGGAGLGFLRNLFSMGSGSVTLPAALMTAASAGPITMASLLNPKTEEEKKAMSDLEEAVGISGEAVIPEVYDEYSIPVGIARSKADRAFSMNKEKAKELEDIIKSQTEIKKGDKKNIPPSISIKDQITVEPEQSNADVINEYMNMFKSVLGSDQDELTRQKYLELAKFGTNLLAQGGGKRGLMEKIGAAGTQSLEGLSKIAAQERASDRQIKLAAIQAAMKEMDPGTVGKAVRDLKKLVPKEKGESSKDYNARITSMALETGTGAATRANTAYAREKDLADRIEKSELVDTPAAALNAAKIITNYKIATVPKKETETRNELKDKEYYIRKDGIIYRYDAVNKKGIFPGEPGF